MQTRMLGLDVERKDRLARINEPHIAPLTDLADDIAQEMRWWTPYFDPESGGTAAQVLFLLESPGPKVSETGFVSQDNPDQTAENMTQLLEAADLSRLKTVLWNIVPWQMSAARVVTPRAVQLQAAAPFTLSLLALLPQLNAVVLVGKKAQAGWKHIQLPTPHKLKIFDCPHPSPQNFNARPDQREEAVRVLRKVAALIRQ